MKKIRLFNQKKGFLRDEKGRNRSPTKSIRIRDRDKREKRDKVLFIKNKTTKRYIFI